MERTISIFLTLCICMLLCSCENKELPVPVYDRGGVQTGVAELTSNYKNQVWYRLDDNSVVSVNNKTAWDIAFESSAAGGHVILNTSKSMKVYKTNFSDLSLVTDTIGLAMHSKCDLPSGNMDSTAIGDWQSNNTVYIINRGYNELAQHQGYYKLKITGMSAAQFTIEYADIYGSGSYSATINKDNNYNFAAYSFTTHAQLNIEPKKTDYDLCFTQYTHVFYDPFQYYLVTGVLINSYNTRVMPVLGKPFTSISISDTVGNAFSKAWNAIGYDWKSYDIASNIYTVDVNKCYIINDNKGFYYKLHFVDFYNSSGIKGYPKFEFKKL